MSGVSPWAGTRDEPERRPESEPTGRFWIGAHRPAVPRTGIQSGRSDGAVGLS
jgi:hypothetical protein